MVRITGAFIDWDGTLCNSYRAKLKAMRLLIRHFGLKPTREILRALPLGRFEVYRLAGLEEKWGEAEEVWTVLCASGKKELFPHAIELLNWMGEKGICRVLISNEKREVLEAEIGELGVKERVNALLLYDGLLRAEVLLEAVARLSLKPEELVLIGDRPEDVRAAREVGIFSIAVSGGFARASELKATEPNRYAGTLGRTLLVLERLQRRRGRLA